MGFLGLYLFLMRLIDIYDSVAIKGIERNPDNHNVYKFRYEMGYKRRRIIWIKGDENDNA